MMISDIDNHESSACSKNKRERIRIVRKQERFEERNTTTIRINLLTIKIVQQATGFPNLASLLAFVAIVNEGEIEQTNKNNNKYTYVVRRVVLLLRNHVRKKFEPLD